jgi:23S rRNA (guanine2445-N2)-methyltransferase / 23S rRNA (guanine2069-N7)-methyltransferase
VERRELSALDTSSVAAAKPGIVVVNPPYGERLGDVEALKPLYRTLGDRLKPAFEGWSAFVMTGNPDLAKEIRLKPARRHVLFNGAIECRLFSLPVDSSGVRRPLPEPAALVPSLGGVARPEAEGFANRLRKNLKHVRKWAKREGISCYRVYDADLPEYKVAIDVYESFAHVQEYAPPKTVDPIAAEARISDVMALAPTLLGVAPEDVFLKVRRRQAGHAQYEKIAESGALHEVHESGLTFLVNFTDHLDTGLFLDHRLTRRLIRTLAQGRHFLNLFAYTGTATVYAAAGGAKTTTTVDLSNTYLSWAEKNLAANRFQGREHSLVRADCLDFLDAETRRYGLIFLDPPTFSTSKSMDETLDVQRDHVALLTKASRLLEPGGILLFSNNFRRFRMHKEELASLSIEDMTEETLPEDFVRSPRVHNAWRITRR